MRQSRAAFGCLLLLAIAVAAGCASAVATGSDASPAAEGSLRTIYVVRHGWHTGIVVPAAHVPEAAWPARRDFAGADYLEVGWGDRAYYQAPDPDAWLALRALFWPTPSVLHVAGYDRPLQPVPHRLVDGQPPLHSTRTGGTRHDARGVSAPKRTFTASTRYEVTSNEVDARA